MAWEQERLELPGMWTVRAFLQKDERGSFCKMYEREKLVRLGMEEALDEAFFTRSQKGVLRGLHIQCRHPQAKLVYVLEGEIFDVGVDLRKGASTYGKWAGVTLSAKNQKGLYLPAGFAHGFLVRSPWALVGYFCSGPYEKESDSGVIWCDESIGIDWGLTPGQVPILSEKDQALPTLLEYERRGRQWDR